MAKQKKEENDSSESQNLLGSFLKENKEDHYNFEKAREDYKVSSGSLIFDLKLGGGLNAGLHRFTGISESGKTSAAFAFMNNFLKMERSKGVYIKAEGRLSENIRERSGVKFVFNTEDWVEGTCFVFESNIYETVAMLIERLVQNNPENLIYSFILDSVDGLMPKGDVGKSFADSAKIAGGAVIAGVLMKKISIPLAKRGHMAIFISQVRSNVQLDPYSKEPVRQTSATGGNALLHFSNWILEFEPRFFGDLILKNPSEKKHNEKTNPIVGHFAKATIKKSTNEQTNNVIRYPIKHGRSNGKSVWVEKELIDLIEAWAFVEKKGSWLKFSQDFLDLVAEAGIELPLQVQGKPKLFDLIESNEKLVDFLVDYFSKQLSAA